MPGKNLNLEVFNIVQTNTTIVYFYERVYLTSLTSIRVVIFTDRLETIDLFG